MASSNKNINITTGLNQGHLLVKYKSKFHTFYCSMYENMFLSSMVRGLLKECAHRIRKCFGLFECY